MFLLRRLQCKTVITRCSKFRHGSGIRDAAAGIMNFDKVPARCQWRQLRLSALEIKMNGMIAGRLFSVHFSGWFPSTHVNRLLGLFLRKNGYRTIFLNFPLMFLTNVCFEKCNKKEMSPCLFRRFKGPNLPHYMPVLALIKYFITSIGLRYILLRLEARVF